MLDKIKFKLVIMKLILKERLYHRPFEWFYFKVDDSKFND